MWIARRSDGIRRINRRYCEKRLIIRNGLILGNLNLIDVFSDPDNLIKAPNGDEFYSVTIAYHTKEAKAKLVIDEIESLGFDFIDINKLPKNIVDSHRVIINRFNKLYDI